MGIRILLTNDTYKPQYDIFQMNFPFQPVIDPFYVSMIASPPPICVIYNRLMNLNFLFGSSIVPLLKFLARY
jgi:hypothetical protein